LQRECIEQDGGLSMSTEAPIALIFGAGKVGRGFLGQLLSRSGYQLWFVDRDAALVARLEAARRYPVLVMQELPRRVSVEGVKALHSGDTDAVAERFAQAAVVLTAVGGPHLPDVARQIARGVERRWGTARETPLNILIGENYYRPGELLRQQILALARGVCAESGAALVRRHGFDPDEQRAFAEGCLAKYQDRTIADPVERNARDPLRKLGRHDRLVGPACLCLEYGIAPEHLATAIAAALHYNPAADPSAQRLQQRLQCEGLDAVLKDVCGVDPDS